MVKRKNKKKSMSKTTGKSLGVRGGYASAPFKPRAFVPPKDIGGYLRKFTREKAAFVGTVLKRDIQALAEEEALKLYGKYHKKLSDKAVKTLTDFLHTGVYPKDKGTAINGSSAYLPFMEKDSLAATGVAGLVKHKTKFVTGTPSSKSVKMISEEWGTTRKSIFDSKIDIKKNRQSLNGAVGFNQKNYTFFGAQFYPNVRDYLNLYNIADKSPQFVNKVDQAAYGMVVKEEVKITIANRDKFLPINFKFHLIGLRDKDCSMETISTVTFTQDISKYDKDENSKNSLGFIPGRYQFSNLKRDPYKQWVMCSLRSNLEMSPGFRQNARISHTLSKKLEAGEVWEITIINYCGSGIRFDNINYDYKVKSTVPTHHGYVLESYGDEITGLQHNEESPNLPDQYIGTSPGWYSMEGLKRITLCNSNSTIPSDDPEISSDYAIKFYKRDDKSSKEFNVNPEDINRTDTASGFYIPLMTDLTQQAAGILNEDKEQKYDY